VPGNGDFDLLSGPPAPINPSVADEAGSKANALDHESADAAVATAGANHDTTMTTANSLPTSGVQYTVQPGDTLSGLAAQYLGNNSRYIELFDANRELLATPDDLKPGMVLMIPDAAPSDERIEPAEDSSMAEPDLIIRKPHCSGSRRRGADLRRAPATLSPSAVAAVPEDTARLPRKRRVADNGCLAENAGCRRASA
jgi:LysM repeat protein